MIDYLFDGAFGTYYQRLTGSGENPEQAVLNNPYIVREIHQRYIQSGANAIKTNTFGANTAVYNDAKTVKAIIKAGYRIAQEAAGVSCAVFADIGPVRSESPEADGEYLRIVEAFMEEGAVNFLFETFPGAEGLLPAIDLIKKNIKDSVVITSFAVSQDGYTAEGEYFIDLFEKTGAAGADYTGLNCICGPAHMLELISRCDTAKYRISAMPNAGYPSVVNGRLVYIDNPDYFAGKLGEIASRGARVIGGCCGTTPDHIAAIKRLLGEKSVSEPKSGAYSPRIAVPRITEEVPDKHRKLIAVEIDPPVDADVSFLMSAAEKAKACGADYVTLADSPLARTRADSFMLAGKIQREIGIKTIPHLTCRDKNQIAIKAQLLAGNIEGIRNVLAVTGDPVTKTNRSDLKDVFGFNSYKLISFIAKLNADIFGKTPYAVYGALNINSVNFPAELRRAEEKLRNGACGLFTQPVYTKTHIENLRAARERLKCRLFAGILPFASLKNALFLNNEVTGIDIPRETVESLKGASEEEVRSISVGFCKSRIDDAYDLCDGYYIMTPMKKIDFVLDLITYIRSGRK